jgi:hypothetical protein
VTQEYWDCGQGGGDASGGGGKGGGKGKGKAVRLFAGAWSAPIVAVNSLATYAKDGPVVALALSSDDVLAVQDWVAANGGRRPTTCVHVHAEGDSSVLIEKAGGVEQVKASVQFFGPEEGRVVHSGVRPVVDDEPVEASGNGISMVAMCRITVSAEFANAATFAAVCKRPNGTPALVLPAEVAKLVIRTSAIASYKDAVTCLIRVKAEDADKVVEAKRQRGVFCQQTVVKREDTVDYSRQEADGGSVLRCRCRNCFGVQREFGMEGRRLRGHWCG